MASYITVIQDTNNKIYMIDIGDISQLLRDQVVMKCGEIISIPWDAYPFLDHRLRDLEKYEAKIGFSPQNML